MKKLDFMEQLNQSFKKGGLSCSFNDNQMAEYVQQKIRAAGRIEKKYAVAKIGFQKKTSRDAGCWVLGPSLYFDHDGKPLNPEASKYIWIGHLVSGRGIAPQSTACPIPKPLSLRPLHKLFKWLERNMKHNFIPTVLVIGGCAMAMHYLKLAKKCMFCPVPLAFGYKCGTGKTTALRCGLSVVGAYPNRYFSRGTYQKYLDLCTESFLPLGVDDPKTNTAISDLTAALFNGAQETTLGRGNKLPISTAVIAANFTTTQEEKYVCTMYVTCVKGYMLCVFWPIQVHIKECTHRVLHSLFGPADARSGKIEQPVKTFCKQYWRNTELGAEICPNRNG